MLLQNNNSNYMITWNIDNAHSEIGFKVKHLVISTVRGKFTKFEASITGEDEDLTKSTINFSADADSINTGNDTRDAHLKSAEFFDAAVYPKLTFKSKSITKKSDTDFTVVGDLSIHGVTKEITLNAIYNGATVSPYGVGVKSFEAHGSLSRESFGLVWNAPLETGGVAVSDEVKLEIIAEFNEVK